jgi:hypothetical protein
MPYYDNPGMLRLHLATWAGYPKELRDRFRFVIVDDASPNSPAAMPIFADPVDAEIRLYRIDRDVPWGWPAAKNIAMHEIPDGPALVTDIDHVLEADDAARLVAMTVRDDTHYIPARRKVDRTPYKRHPSTYILQRSLYWKVGGYEENWLGLYGTDFMMRDRAKRLSERVETDEVTLTLYSRDDIADASTTTLTRKDGPYYSGAMPEVRAAMRRATAGPVQKVMTQSYERVL